MTRDYGWWFESERFRDVARTEQAVNPGRYGETLARFLAARLEERSWQVVGCFPEDWGWLVELKAEGRVLGITCGNEDGSMVRWHVGPLARAGVWQRIFGRAPSPALLQRVDDELRAILEADPTTSRIDREQPEDPPPDATP
jgi:hypothetical protein